MSTDSIIITRTGVYEQRNGEEAEVRYIDELDTASLYQCFGSRMYKGEKCSHMWTRAGRSDSRAKRPTDLVRYLRPLDTDYPLAMCPLVQLAIDSITMRFASEEERDAVVVWLLRILPARKTMRG